MIALFVLPSQAWIRTDVGHDKCLETYGGICTDSRGGVNELTVKLVAEGRE